MQRTINQIITIEQKAKNIVAEANKHRAELPELIKKTLSDMREKALTEAETQVSKTKKEELEVLNKTLKMREKEHNTLMMKLDELEKEHLDEWAQDLYKRVISQ